MKVKKVKAQFSFDRLYVSPFTRKRGFDEEHLKVIYVPMDIERLYTGVDVLDAVVDRLVEGRNPSRLAREWGLSTAQLSIVVLALTGMGLQELQSSWRVKLCDDLLRYTDLSLSDVMHRCGFTSATAFSRFVRLNHGVSPLHFRTTRRQQGELGMYAL